jgi:hypothetical protein
MRHRWHGARRRRSSRASRDTGDERRLLVNLFTVEIDVSKFPLSPRIEALKRIEGEAARRGGARGGAPRYTQEKAEPLRRFGAIGFRLQLGGDLP